MPPLDHPPAPAARPSPPDPSHQDNQTETQRAREGTGKRRQQPLKRERDGKGRRQPLTRARAFIPRPVVCSKTQDHLKEGRPLQCLALQAQSVSIKADQTSTQQGTTAQPIQAKRTAKTRGRERSHPARHVLRGETGTGGGSSSGPWPPAGGQSRRKGRGAAENDVLQENLQAAGCLVALMNR